MEIFGFEVNHEYIIQYVKAVEHNSWTFEVNFYTFSVFQTVWGILYTSDEIVENKTHMDGKEETKIIVPDHRESKQPMKQA